MADYYFSEKAVDDLTMIWNYSVEVWSERQADKYYELLMISCNELARNPKLGKIYDILEQGVLGYKCGEHIIFYRMVSEGDIEVVRILHGTMDIKSRL